MAKGNNPTKSMLRAGSVAVSMEKKDAAKDKKMGIKENSKKDVKMDAKLMKKKK